jgi:Putative Ig domain
LTLTRRLTPVLFLFALAACDGSLFGSDRHDGQGPVADNTAPVISGQPPTKATVGRPYYFRPSAYDPDGDAIQFRAARLPSWAKLDAATGAVSGTPPAEAAGTSALVEIAVTDGELQTVLPAFRITVAPATKPTPDTSRSATLNWSPPLQNDDGTPLMDLAGYRVYYGDAPGNLSRWIGIANPAAVGTTVTGLTPGTWYFAVSSVNAAGLESLRSPAVAVALN